MEFTLLRRLQKQARTERNPLLKEESQRLVGFILTLRKRGIPLSHINVNDWGSSLKPGVYVKNKYNQFSERGYFRCAGSDVGLAVAFYNRKPKVKGRR